MHGLDLVRVRPGSRFALCPPEYSDLAVMGGAWFPPAPGGRAPTLVRAADQVFSPVGFIACQDVDGNGLCGGANDPRVRGCDAAALAGSRADLPLVVRVLIESPVGASVCGATSMGTSGMITVSYA